MWSGSFRTPELLREAMRASNDWAKETLMDHSPRLIPTAQVSTMDIDDAVAEDSHRPSGSFSVRGTSSARRLGSRERHRSSGSRKCESPELAHSFGAVMSRY